MRSIDVDADPLVAILRGVLWLGRRLRAERPGDKVSLSGISVLSTLRRVGPLSASRLAEEEGLQAQSLTRVLAGLERLRYIERRRSETDRREIIIAVTLPGEAALAEDMRGRREWLARAMAEGLDDAERDALQNAAAAMTKLARFGPPDRLAPPRRPGEL